MERAGMMEIAFGSGVVNADAKAGWINLNTLETVGNMFLGLSKDNRKEAKYKRLDNWLANKETKDFIELCSKKHNENNNILNTCNSRELEYKEVLQVKRGRYGGTWATLHIAIDFAMWIDLEFKYEVIDTFINKKILDLRVLGIDYYNEMKDSVENLTYRKEKDNHKNFMINLNKKINTKVNGEFVKGWDHLLADADKQAHRKRILDFIKQAFTMDLPKSNEDVWDIVGKIN